MKQFTIISSSFVFLIIFLSSLGADYPVVTSLLFGAGTVLAIVLFLGAFLIIALIPMILFEGAERLLTDLHPKLEALWQRYKLR